MTSVADVLQPVIVTSPFDIWYVKFPYAATDTFNAHIKIVAITDINNDDNIFFFIFTLLSVVVFFHYITFELVCKGWINYGLSP